MRWSEALVNGTSQGDTRPISGDPRYVYQPLEWVMKEQSREPYQTFGDLWSLGYFDIIYSGIFIFLWTRKIISQWRVQSQLKLTNQISFLVLTPKLCVDESVKREIALKFYKHFRLSEDAQKRLNAKKDFYLFNIFRASANMNRLIPTLKLSNR